MVEYNLAKVNVEGSNPFFCLMDPKAVFGISILKNNGNNNRIDIFICDYRLIGKSFIFQVNIVGSNPTNHNRIFKGEMAEWLKAADCKFVEIFLRRFKSYFLQP